MTTPSDKSQKAMLVTGASGGIGREISLAVDAAVGAGALYEGDIRERHAVQQMVDTACRLVPTPSVFICNAGVGKSSLVLTQREEDWATVLATNLTGTFHCLRAMAPPLLACGGGSIVVIGSHAGYHGTIGPVAYAAS